MRHAAQRETPQLAQFFAATTEEAILRLAHLPYVISTDPMVVEALRSDSAFNLGPNLSRFASRARAQKILILDINGKAVASSDQDAPESTLGQYFTFRPYFQEAIAGQSATFYAVDNDTGQPVYHIAEPLRDAAGTVFGAVVVRVSLADLAAAWAESGELILVTDPRGVVLASSEPELAFTLTRPLSAYELRTLEERRQLGDRLRRLLDWEVLGEKRVRLDGRTYLWSTAEVRSAGWTLHLLSDLGEIRTRAALILAISVAGFLVLVVATTVFRSARLRAALALSNADRRRLVSEIEERRIAEERLREARAALARKERLATLGQLAASVTHELGQPISAMRNHLVAEEIAAGAKPGELAPDLSRLVGRMERIVQQLRAAGQPTQTSTDTFALTEAISSALQLVRHDAEQAGVDLEVVGSADPAVNGSPYRLEQVIVNLVRNGIDASRGQEVRHVTVCVESRDGEACLSIRDTGPGLGGARTRAPLAPTAPSCRVSASTWTTTMSWCSAAMAPRRKLC
ncbi:MAG: cache domain-containing protein, partial [Pseudomonadota bacterium]